MKNILRKVSWKIDWIKVKFNKLLVSRFALSDSVCSRFALNNLLPQFISSESLFFFVILINSYQYLNPSRLQNFWCYHSKQTTFIKNTKFLSRIFFWLKKFYALCAIDLSFTAMNVCWKLIENFVKVCEIYFLWRVLFPWMRWTDWSILGYI